MKNLFVTLNSPQEKNLSPNQKEVLAAVVQRLEAEGLSLRPDSLDSIKELRNQINKSQGCVILAFSQWEGHRLYRSKNQSIIFPSEYTHITLSAAIEAKKPVLVIREKQVSERGTLRGGYTHPIVEMPNSATGDWLESNEFRKGFAHWLKIVRKQKHVFLGYASQAKSTADKITRYLTETVGLSILDWHDFPPSQTVIDAIKNAECLTGCGIFLFMADDKLEGSGPTLGTPRDNVVYEAGYFAGAKGHEHTVIITERGTKVPTDFAGVLCLELYDRHDISPIKTKLAHHFDNLFEWT
jgi:hypothetical protein